MINAEMLYQLQIKCRHILTVRQLVRLQTRIDKLEQVLQDNS